MPLMKEAILEENYCNVDQKDGKTRFRVWAKDPNSTSVQPKLTIKLTDKERLKLIHMLSE